MLQNTCPSQHDSVALRVMPKRIRLSIIGIVFLFLFIHVGNRTGIKERSLSFVLIAYHLFYGVIDPLCAAGGIAK